MILGFISRWEQKYSYAGPLWDGQTVILDKMRYQRLILCMHLCDVRNIRIISLLCVAKGHFYTIISPILKINPVDFPEKNLKLDLLSE